jgi:hypothetical protein
VHATPFRDPARVVVLPAGAGQFEQALALGEAGRGVRRRVDEDVAVIECGHEADVLRKQHAVAEDVA